GVTPPGFAGAAQAGESPDVSVPLAHFLRVQPTRDDRTAAWYWWIRIMGRLAPGATAAQARAELEPIFQQAAREGWLDGRARGRPAARPGPRPAGARRRLRRAGRDQPAAPVLAVALHADGSRRAGARRGVRECRQPAARARRVAAARDCDAAGARRRPRPGRR